MHQGNGTSAGSIGDIARGADVSAATVSRAFAEPELVRQETQEEMSVAHLQP